jgi:hypothetical protein
MSVHPLNRRLHGLAIQAALVATLAWSPARPAEAADEGTLFRVRSSDSAITAFIELAATRSPTFRNLLALIQASDGIVYVEPGDCGNHGARACLKGWMGAAGPNRLLRVMVNRRRANSDVDFMGSIGHELQHTVEALSEPATINSAALYNFFTRIAPSSSGRFETLAAINAGDAVREELSRRRRY